MYVKQENLIKNPADTDLLTFGCKCFRNSANKCPVATINFPFRRYIFGVFLR